jgi:hypothetical protein
MSLENEELSEKIGKISCELGQFIIEKDQSIKRLQEKEDDLKNKIFELQQEQNAKFWNEICTCSNISKFLDQNKMIILTLFLARDLGRMIAGTLLKSFIYQFSPHKLKKKY